MFYANRLCEGPLKLNKEGVVRISLVHCISSMYFTKHRSHDGGS